MCKALSKCVHGVRRQHHPELDVAIDLPPSSPISLPSRASSPPTPISTLAGRPHPKSVVSYTPCLRPTHGHGRAKHRQHPAQPPARAFQHALLHLPDRAPIAEATAATPSIVSPERRSAMVASTKQGHTQLSSCRCTVYI
jgi:hypothetical protein